MNILIICTFYPPDTAISALRPYLIAKYLAKRGHKITVLRSGMINKTADRFYPVLKNVRVISFLGQNSAAERFERGEPYCNTAIDPKSRIAFLSPPLRKIVSSVYHWIDTPRQYCKRKRLVAKRLELQKREIDGLRNEHIDIVFSTYSDLENAFAGKYAKKVLGCKWIMDFRDPIAQGSSQTKWEYKLSKNLQDGIIRSADACTAVSDSLLMENGRRDSKIHTLFNGYDDQTIKEEYPSTDSDVFSFCYTGQIYGMQASAAAALVKVIASLVHCGKVDIHKIRFQFAGNGIDEFRIILRQYGVEEILVDHGYMSKSEIIRLQNSCDLFVVLSWNTQKEQGVLTGKFYEGIRAHRPILSLIAGDVPDSELYQLNRKYNYGFCYEIYREKQQFDSLQKFILDAYHQKMTTGHVAYSPHEALFSAFRYDFIASQLEQLCFSLIHNETIR